jgi:hypothetical protein
MWPISLLLSRHDDSQRFPQSGADRGAGGEADLLATGGHYRAGAADHRSDRRSFSAAGDGADDGTGSCADAPLLQIPFRVRRGLTRDAIGLNPLALATDDEVVPMPPLWRGTI